MYISRKTQIYLTDEQKQSVDYYIKMRKEIWNKLVEEYNEPIDMFRRLPKQTHIERFLGGLYPELKARFRRSIIMDYFEAWRLCFTVRDHKRPHFHSYKKINSYNLYDTGHFVYRKRINIIGLGKFSNFAEDLSEFDHVEVPVYTVSRRRDKYYISLTFKIDSYTKIQNQDGEIGLDWGVKTLFTDSNNEQYNLPPSLFRQEMRIKKLQSYMDRKQLGSKNREKAKSKLNRAWERYNNIKKDYIEKFTYKLCLENSIIGLEDLDLIEMRERNFRNTRRKMLQNSYGQTRDRLIQKSERFDNCKVILVDRFFRSSQICSNCGQVHTEMRDLGSRDFVCECGLNIDRDYNAALNIKNEAIRLASSV